MISLAGNDVNIKDPWVFEDSGINKIGNIYFNFYCINWSSVPFGNARIVGWLGALAYQGTNIIIFSKKYNILKNNFL